MAIKGEGEYVTQVTIWGDNPVRDALTLLAGLVDNPNAWHDPEKELEDRELEFHGILKACQRYLRVWKG